MVPSSTLKGLKLSPPALPPWGCPQNSRVINQNRRQIVSTLLVPHNRRPNWFPFIAVLSPQTVQSPSELQWANNPPPSPPLTPPPLSSSTGRSWQINCGGSHHLFVKLIVAPVEETLLSGCLWGLQLINSTSSANAKEVRLVVESVSFEEPPFHSLALS